MILIIVTGTIKQYKLGTAGCALKTDETSDERTRDTKRL